MSRRHIIFHTNITPLFGCFFSIYLKSTWMQKEKEIVWLLIPDIVSNNLQLIFNFFSVIIIVLWHSFFYLLLSRSWLSILQYCIKKGKKVCSLNSPPFLLVRQRTGTTGWDELFGKFASLLTNQKFSVKQRKRKKWKLIK